MKTILSKKKIKQLRRQYKGTEIEKLCTMAELHRQYQRAKANRQRTKPKKYLKSTDYLSPEQFARILTIVVNAADKDRLKTKAATRNIKNEMLIIIMAETGLRAAEIINLKGKDLPGYHEKPEIIVRQGKGHKDRTVGISDYLMRKITDYQHKYHISPENWLFASERNKSKHLSYLSLYFKIKNIGKKSGIWVNKDKSRLKPHNFRHTFATLLLDESDNEFLVQTQLGHENTNTTKIYTRTLTEKLRGAMNKFHKRLFCNYTTELFDNFK